MAKALTKKAMVDAEKLRISQLTSQHDAYFKVIFSHQIEAKYNFQALIKGKKSLKDKALIQMFTAFGKFFDESIMMTITDVENAFGRKDDKSDGTYDPESGTQVQVEHLCLYRDGDAPQGSDSVRLHGYFRTNGGYFVVTRLDWFHNKHKH